jgi:hypothetical protein
MCGCLITLPLVHVSLCCSKVKGRTVKAPCVSHIVDEQNAHGAPVIRRRDGPEALLARSVPYLELHALAVELDGADLEVDADGRDEGRRERVFAEPQQAARFAYARVAD